MDRFDDARMFIPGNAWDDSGRKRSALSDFSKAIQGKPVTKEGLIEALMGLDIWSWSESSNNSKVTEVEISEFHAQSGRAVAYLANKYNVNHVKVSIKWDEKDVIKDTSKKSAETDDLEKRVAALEAQVALLTKMITAK